MQLVRLKPRYMKNLLPLILFCLLATGCVDEEADEGSDFISAESMSKENASRKNESVGGLHYSMDSISHEIICKTSSIALKNLCLEIVERLAKKDRVLEYTNNLGPKYAYHLSQPILDSLAIYNYDKSNMGTNSDQYELTLHGIAPYKNKGLWENFTVKGVDFEKKHPILYQRAKQEFFNKEKPEITELAIENQGGNFVEYNAKIKFASGNEKYIHFTVTNKSQAIVLEIGGEKG